MKNLKFILSVVEGSQIDFCSYVGNGKVEGIISF